MIRFSLRYCKNLKKYVLPALILFYYHNNFTVKKINTTIIINMNVTKNGEKNYQNIFCFLDNILPQQSPTSTLRFNSLANK